MSTNTDEQIKQEAIRIIGQGTYGCILYPGFDCNGVPNENMKYLSKIQLNNENTTKENEIGKIIMSIPNYQLYYAPVISSCDINISEMVDNENVKECDIVKKYRDSQIDGSLSSNANDTYSMNKIFYVGNEDVKKYMNRVIVEETETSIMYKIRLIIDMHIIILYELMQIAEKNIIHFDLKSNNIMMNSITGLPVVIDFGMSYLIESLKTQEGIDENIIRFESHDYWCFDILLMSEIKKLYKNNPDVDWKSEVLTPTRKEEIVAQFVSDGATNKNGELEEPVFINLYSAQIQVQIKHGLLEYLNGNSINTWGDLYNVITSPNTMKTWDNYSVAVIVLLNLKTAGFNEAIGNENALWQKYIGILNNIMFAPPDKRQTAQQTKTEIEQLFTNISSVDYENMNRNHEIGEYQTQDVPPPPSDSSSNINAIAA